MKILVKKMVLVSVVLLIAASLSSVANATVYSRGYSRNFVVNRILVDKYGRKFVVRQRVLIPRLYSYNSFGVSYWLNNVQVNYLVNHSFINKHFLGNNLYVDVYGRVCNVYGQRLVRGDLNLIRLNNNFYFKNFSTNQLFIVDRHGKIVLVR